MAQGQRSKQSGNNTGGGNSSPQSSVRPAKSRTPFFALLIGIVAIGAGFIYFKMQSAPQPIVLSSAAALPKAEGYLLGDPNAPVTIIEFADFECPQCAAFSTVTEPDIRKNLIETGKANLRFFDYPLPDKHPNSLFASLAASCAADQGKFWEMHDLLLAGQTDWEGRVHKNPVPVFEKYAKQIGLDLSKYKACFDSRDNIPRIQAHQKEGDAVNISSTPTFLISGTLFPGNQPYDRLKMFVELATERAAEQRDSASKANAKK